MGAVATGSARLAKLEKFSPASKFIELVEYDPKANTMDLTFKSGSKYRYFEVYPATFLTFQQSPTFDAFYARAIKGNLQSSKLVDAGIGRTKSAPLDRVKQESKFDAGIKRQQARSERIRGTVARAFAAV